MAWTRLVNGCAAAALLLGVAGGAKAADPATVSTCTASAALPPFPSAPLLVPDPGGLDLQRACEALLRERAADPDVRGRVDPDALGTTETAERGKLRSTCQRLEIALGLRSGTAALDADDLANLRVVLRPPPGVALRIQEAIKGLAEEQALELASPTTLGSLESRFVNGLASFVADRFRAEAEFVLRTELHDKLCGKDAAAAKFLPNTCRALSDSITGTPLHALGAYLRAAGERDLAFLPDRALGEIACTLPDDEASRLHGAALQAGRIAMAFALATREGQDPFELARSLRYLRLPCDGTERSDARCASLARALPFLGSALQALQQQPALTASGAGTFDARQAAYRAVAAVSAFKELYAETPDALRLNVEAMWAPKRLGDVSRRLGAALVRLGQLRVTAQRIREAMSPVQQPGEPPVQPRIPREEIAALTSDLFALSGVVLDAIDRDAADDLAVIRKALVEVRRFEAALNRVAASASTGDFVVASLELVHLATPAAAKLENALPTELMSRLPLFVELANAQSSDQVAKTLQAAAAPVGSWRVKMQRAQVSVSAFVGVTAGRERLDDVGTATDGRVAGVAAPIGLHGTIPIGGGWVAAGAMLSVLDPGNLVSFRREGDDALAKSEPNVGFAQVLSPGGYLTLQVKPVVFGFGVSAAPSLRDVVVSPATGAAEAQVSSATAFRISGFVALDLTLLPLF